MKILDRYIARHFVWGYAIAFSVLVGMRIVIDLFVNLDEFAEHTDKGMWQVFRHTATYYAIHTTLYFREFAGMITVVAAAFSLGKLVRSNELIAIMASGVSLKRIVAPILAMSILLTGLAVVNQEILIPRFSADLVRHRDQVAGEDFYAAWFLTDRNNSLICGSFVTGESAFHDITIITRRPMRERPGISEVTGHIQADKAVYNPATRAWDLENGLFIPADDEKGPEPRTEYRADGLVPRDIPVLVMADDKSLLSWRQLGDLIAHNPRDIAQIYSQKNFRITEHIINLVILLVSLPVLLVRDPRTMKNAVMVSFGLTAACMVVTFGCKMLATEDAVFRSLTPEFWAWLPVFIFVPVAFIELDTMKT
jgi:lipopolysaccharide export system permease protein